MAINKDREADYIGNIQVTLALADSNECNVQHRLYATELPLDDDTEYDVELYIPRGPDGEDFVAEFTTKHSSNRITLPKPVITANDEVCPGRTVIAYIYHHREDKQKELSAPKPNDDKDVEELIREMHGMMMEMYNEWMQQQND